MQDQKVIVTIVKLYHKLLSRYIRRIIRDEWKAYDLVSDVFLKFFLEEPPECSTLVRERLKRYAREACHDWLYVEMKKLIETKKITLQQLQQINPE